MSRLMHLNRSEREAVRMQFFREHRGVGGCASVAVRTDATTGEPYLSVGVLGQATRVPGAYEGLTVRTYETKPASYAVQYQ